MSLAELTTRTVEQKRLAARVYLVLVVVFLASVLVSIYFDFQKPSPRLHLLTGSYALGMVAIIAAYWLNAQDKWLSAALIAVITLMIVNPLASVLIAGLGLALGIAVLAESAMLSALILPGRYANRVIPLGVFSAIVTLLSDTFDFPPGRLAVPQLQIVAPILVGVTLSIIGFFVVRLFSTYALRVKLLILMLGAGFISIVAVAGFVNYSTQQTLRQRSNDALLTAAGHTAESLNTYLGYNIELVNSRSSLPTLVTYLQTESVERQNQTPEISQILSDWVKNESEISGVSTGYIGSYALLDKNGINLVDTYTADIGIDNSDRDYFQTPMQIGRPYLTPVRYSPELNDYGFYIGAPVIDSFGNRIGVLRAHLKASILQAFIDSNAEAAGEQSFAILTDEYSVIQAYSGHPELARHTPLTLPNSTYQLLVGRGQLSKDQTAQSISLNLPQFAESLTKSSSNPLFTGSDAAWGAPVQVGVAGLTNAPWKISFIQPVAVALAPVKAQSQIIVVIALITGLIVTILGFQASKTISDPILGLTDTANQFTAGDFSVRANATTKDEIGVLAAAFNSMSDELQKLIGGLEQRVAERTFDLAQASQESERRAQELRSIAEISASIGNEQKLEKLLPLITNLVREKFDFYHTGIFLVDPSGRYAVLQAANSQGGQRMLARNHRLEVGQTGLVGFVAQTGHARIALDVGADAVYFSNPDLPETRSEIALPLNVRGETIGVLDVQSEKAGAFSQTDIDTLSVLADQVAIAIDNARLFGNAQQTLSETQALYSQYLSQQWQGFLQEETQIGYQQTIKGGEKLTVTLENDDINQALQRGRVIVKNHDDESAVMVIPVRLRSQIIGVVNVKALRKGQSWSPDEINMVQAISDRLALTLETARLFQEAQRRATTERAIGDVATKLATAQDIDSILRLTAEELGKLLTNSKVAIQINPMGNQK